MSEPPIKRLKQSSISDCFTFGRQKPQNNTTKESPDIIIIDDTPITATSHQSHSIIGDQPVSIHSDASSKKVIHSDVPSKVIHSDIPSKKVIHSDAPSEKGATSTMAMSLCEGASQIGNVTSIEKTMSPVSAEHQHTAMPDQGEKTEATFEYPMSPDLFTDSEPLDVGVDIVQELKLGQNRDIAHPVFGSSEPLDVDVDDIKDPEELEDEMLETSAKMMDIQPMGTPIAELNKSFDCSPKLPPLQKSVVHKVLFKLPHSHSNKTPPTPFPNSYKDSWNTNHVRMPCSPMNEYPDGDQVRRRWEIIQESLLKDIAGPFELEETILRYNARYTQKWDFTALRRLFTEELDEDECNYFFKHTLKDMTRLALQLPHLCTQPIPLLKTGFTHSLTLSQQQISCLLANAFFCTFPRRNAHHKHSEFACYPGINFNTIFTGGKFRRKLEKLKCLIHYFRRVTQKVPTGCVTFTRKCLDNACDWSKSDTRLRRLHIATNGYIEGLGEGMLQVDFANKVIGGGVLGNGCVQEEIRFLICPEMIISRLFTETLGKNECLVMTGCERYSNYTGYADTFTWTGDFQDKTPRDDWGRLMTEVVAMDALRITSHSSQFQPWAVRRELNKAYCGFYDADLNGSQIPAICTGNWGCGAFGGDNQLKAMALSQIKHKIHNRIFRLSPRIWFVGDFIAEKVNTVALIQMMAASEAKRDVCYLTFNDANLMEDIHQIHRCVTLDSPLSIGELLKIIDKYYQDICSKHKSAQARPKIHLYHYLLTYVYSNVMESTPTSDYWDDDEETGQPATKQAPSTIKADVIAVSTNNDNASFDYKADTP